MRILLLEDRGTANQLVSWLEDRQHIVHHALSIRDARSVHLKDIDCIIADLNMSSVGLKEDEIAKTDSGIITGWIWLENYVLNAKPWDMRKNRVIILSEYISYLNDLGQKDRELRKQLVGIEMIPKSDSHVYDKLGRKLWDIQKSLSNGDDNE
ncbi:MAG: hypothetical protein NT018_07910 [Armatimonadetes bacterium]|nr:hypothetical protein [Armatimonadota bacterium]